MLLGLDVGGTFTDAVLIKDGLAVKHTKKPTTHGNLLEGILFALETLLDGVDRQEIERVALSTTIVTNAIVENALDKVGLFMLPGPGVDLSAQVPVAPYVLSGYIDHRGREVSGPQRQEFESFSGQLGQYDVFAVSGKFSVRNPKQEMAVAGWLREKAAVRHITLGSGVSGTLNYWRRTNSAYFNAAVWRRFGAFATAVEQALSERHIAAPVYVLKADGGTMPLELARQQPVEAVFTGPAASVLGIMAMGEFDCPAVSLDIGGTTTDIALWEKGAPLFMAGGARIGEYPTAVRSFRLQSVGIGGDSYVRREDGFLRVGPVRKGAAMALGGPVPTVTDAMIVAGIVSFSDKSHALQAMAQIAENGQSLPETAQAVLEAAAAVICKAVGAMLDQQASDPVYRVEDIVAGSRLIPELVIGVGGAACGLVPLVAEKFGVPFFVPEGAMVANAVGAAVARPTLDITLRADTEQGYYTVAELGIRDKITDRRFDFSNAQHLTLQHLTERAQAAGIDIPATEIIQQEEFNIVRGFYTVGKILTCRQQIQPGVLHKVTGFPKEAVL